MRTILFLSAAGVLRSAAGVGPCERFEHAGHNLDELLPGERCDHRFLALDAAWKACLSDSACSGVVMDNGLSCGGSSDVHRYEKRAGTLVKAARPSLNDFVAWDCTPGRPGTPPRGGKPGKGSVESQESTGYPTLKSMAARVRRAALGGSSLGVTPREASPVPAPDAAARAVSRRAAAKGAGAKGAATKGAGAKGGGSWRPSRPGASPQRRSRQRIEQCRALFPPPSPSPSPSRRLQEGGFGSAPLRHTRSALSIAREMPLPPRPEVPPSERFPRPPASELWRHVYYAVLTTHRNHGTRCATIIRTWGSVVPPGHVTFYSDQARNGHV